MNTNMSTNMNMIKSIWIDNFESLVDFQMPLAKFNCIVGLNGAGKSSLLRAFVFFYLLVSEFRSIDFYRKNVASELTNKRNIDFQIELDIEDQIFCWRGSFNPNTLRCTKEVVTENEENLLLVSGNHYKLHSKKYEIDFEYQGSILSVLRESFMGDNLNKLKEEISIIPFLLDEEIEKYGDYGGYEHLESYVDDFVNARDQTIITTYSPLVLNFITDDVAKESIHYLYKSEDGITRHRRLFDIPSMAKKLEFMGAGEAYIDTDLTQLYKEIENIKTQKLQ